MRRPTRIDSEAEDNGIADRRNGERCFETDEVRSVACRLAHSKTKYRSRIWQVPAARL
jgi:hypothetical protein